MDVFDKLDSRLQRVIYHKLGWRDLRPMQKAVISALLTGSGDLLVSAPTASGKTEAAFLPLISKCLQDPSEGLKILCISPLKALMNNQEDRIKRLCPSDSMLVTVWHADASASGKARLKKNPEGILIITPESLEAVLDAAASHPELMFAGTKYVVIDEIHALAGTTRGTHILSLLRRIEALIGRKLDTVGLSATMSNPKECAQWLRPNDPKRVLIITDDGAGTITGTRGEESRVLQSLSPPKDKPSLKGCIYAWDFTKSIAEAKAAKDAQAQNEDNPSKDNANTNTHANSATNRTDPNHEPVNNQAGAFPNTSRSTSVKWAQETYFQKYMANNYIPWEESSNLEPKVFAVDAFLESTDWFYQAVHVEYVAQMLRAAARKKVLAFVNSRDYLEGIFSLLAALKQAGYDFQGVSVLKHHGLMDAQERLRTEKLLSQAHTGVLVLCTSTLELGIDVGDVDEIFFLNAPFSVSSFLQRLGRSGRRAGQVPTFRFFLGLRNFSLGKTRGENNGLNALLYPELARAIALVRLALQKKIEPLTGLFPDASTFVQQILSYIAAERMTTLPAIYKAIGREGFANYFSKNDFIAVMTKLCQDQNPLVEQDPNGMIHLSKKGEYFCEDREFFCSFAAERTIELLENNRLVARIPLSVAPDLIPGLVLKVGDKLWEVLEFIDGEKALVKSCFVAEEALEVSLGGTGGVAASGDLGWELGLVLADNKAEPFMTAPAVTLLNEASTYAWRAEQSGVVFFVWGSSRVLTTIFILLKHLMPEHTFARTNLFIRSRSLEKDYYRGELLPGATPRDYMFQALLAEPITEELLLKAVAKMPVSARRMHKFDELVPQYLLDQEYVRRCLDLEGTISYLKLATANVQNNA